MGALEVNIQFKLIRLKIAWSITNFKLHIYIHITRYLSCSLESRVYTTATIEIFLGFLF